MRSDVDKRCVAVNVTRLQGGGLGQSSDEDSESDDGDGDDGMQLLSHALASCAAQLGCRPALFAHGKTAARVAAAVRAVPQPPAPLGDGGAAAVVLVDRAAAVQAAARSAAHAADAAAAACGAAIACRGHGGVAWWRALAANDIAAAATEIDQASSAPQLGGAVVPATSLLEAIRCGVPFVCLMHPQPRPFCPCNAPLPWRLRVQLPSAPPLACPSHYAARAMSLTAKGSTCHLPSAPGRMRRASLSARDRTAPCVLHHGLRR